MEPEEKFNHFAEMPQDSCGATKYIVDIILNKIHPTVLKLRNKLNAQGTVHEISKIKDVFALSCNQIKKCVLSLFDVFRREHNQGIIMQEARQYNIERLQWCIKRLDSINNHLKNLSDNVPEHDTADNPINVSTVYFVNWIDHTFEVLSKLSDVVYKTDYKENDGIFQIWKNDMIECVSALHLAVDELLLSAMTLCRYCLPGDQHIVKARCQVVLRETKALLCELVEDGLEASIKVSLDSLKLPIMPSNVNVLIDVLKDVLYVLETNTNTALLALLIRCFSNNMSPIFTLRDHFGEKIKGRCTCVVMGDYDVTEDCAVVKEFDMYNERLLQIGSFAVSCSSDQNRILSLRSGLASLEGLDPHLVPALMMSPHSDHSILLMDSWRQEVEEIRNSVFLIVDPAAFAELFLSVSLLLQCVRRSRAQSVHDFLQQKSKQMMHQKLLEVLKDDSYNNSVICSVINIGYIVQDFFEVYEEHEPDALPQHEDLIPLLADLRKVLNECKTVSNLLASKEDFIYDVITDDNQEVSIHQLLKRLKLLYTIVNRINNLLRPKDNDEELFEEEEGRDVTHTLYKQLDTYDVNPKKLYNISRSIFARTTNVPSSTRNIPLGVLMKHLRSEKCEEVNFSVQLDRLFNNSEDEDKQNVTFFVNKKINKLREQSVCNLSPIKNRSSLRKAVLNRHCKSQEKVVVNNAVERSILSKKDSIMDEEMTLEITDILNQMHDMTHILSTTKPPFYISKRGEEARAQDKRNESKIFLTLNVNNDKDLTVSRRIWNIPVNASVVDTPLEESATNSTQPSSVTTLERINDLDLVESKLNSLQTQLETSL